MPRRTLLLLLLLLLLPGCDDSATTPDGDDESPPGDGGAGNPDPSSDTMERYAAHRFVRVGDTISLRGLGAIRESGGLPSGAPLVVESASRSARCESGGVGWISFRYRENAAENSVQTLVVVCVDEEGSCVGQPRVGADLEAYRAGRIPGAADMIAAGDGELYAVCRTDTGVRLQRPPELPPLLYRVVDAWGSGPYSVEGDELDWLRASTVTGFSDQAIRPGWIATIGRSVTAIELEADGSLEVTATPCNESPECPKETDWVRQGDFVIIGFGGPDLRNVVGNAPAEVQRSFAEAHVPGLWDLLGGVAPTAPDYTARDVLLFRLIGLEIMDQFIAEFDGLLGLAERGARVGYGSFWQTRSKLPCLPSDQAICDTAEETLAAYEAARIGERRAQGLEIWWADFLAYEADGSFREPSPPALSAFDGMFSLLDVGAQAEPAVDRSAALAVSIRTLDDFAPASLPLAFSFHWGPMEHVLEMGGFCEGEICPSAFTRYFDAFEPPLVALVETFTPGRIVGLGIPMFDGAHFDIRAPYETAGGLTLNRAAETGFNNPLMGLYYAR